MRVEFKENTFHWIRWNPMDITFRVNHRSFLFVSFLIFIDQMIDWFRSTRMSPFNSTTMPIWKKIKNATKLSENWWMKRFFVSWKTNVIWLVWPFQWASPFDLDWRSFGSTRLDRCEENGTDQFHFHQCEFEHSRIHNDDHSWNWRRSCRSMVTKVTVRSLRHHHHHAHSFED